LAWGLIGGGALLGLILLGVAAAVIIGLVFRPFQPAEPSPGAAVSTTAAPGIESTVIAPVEASATSPAAIETAEALPTSTLFIAVEKPSDVPVMLGAEQLSVYRIEPAQGSTGATVSVSFFSDASAEAILAYYESEMPSNGWQKLNTYSSGEYLMIVFQKKERIAQLVITQKTGQNLVTISVVQN
jgi:hypothetical protein